MGFWDEAYSTPPPWDIGRPQAAFVELVRSGEMKPGRVLDVGCGTGENAIFLAHSGFSVVGIDLVPAAIRLAKTKAVERNAEVDFRIGNALRLDFERDEFDNVIDSGLFHTFTDQERPVFAKQIGRVICKGGNYFMLCFSEREPTDWGGPRRVTKNEIEKTFSPTLRINYIRETMFATRIHAKGGRAYLTSATKFG